MWFLIKYFISGILWNHIIFTGRIFDWPSRATNSNRYVAQPKIKEKVPHHCLLINILWNLFSKSLVLIIILKLCSLFFYLFKHFKKGFSNLGFKKDFLLLDISIENFMLDIFVLWTFLFLLLCTFLGNL